MVWHFHQYLKAIWQGSVTYRHHQFCSELCVLPVSNPKIATHSSILSGEFNGQRSLAGYCPWGHKDSDITKRLPHTHTHTHTHIHTHTYHYQDNKKWKKLRSKGETALFPLHPLNSLNNGFSDKVLTCNHWLTSISKCVWSLRAPCGIFLPAILII